mgnify:CR=1 FL=1|tara:strand:- start:1311 stop:2033 length:723 start_codon:yes stop_codon:yes gene_type:complete
MKILYLGPQDKIYNFLLSKGTVTNIEDPIKPNQIKEYDWVISYGYKHILTKEHINLTKNPILNLHISFLPWNKGADPNYWSWVDDTPKGVTIHAINEEIDGGDIFIQQAVYFERDKETLLSSYNKLKLTIENLFIEYFDRIINKEINPIKQFSKGTIHYKKDFPGIESWDTPVKKLNMTDLEIIDEIEKIRSKNNVNWMDILRLAFKHAPEDARALIGKVNKHDNEISALLAKLSSNGNK